MSELTQKDKEAIARARRCDWSEIDEGWAETEAGRKELHHIATSGYHYEEASAEMI